MPRLLVGIMKVKGVKSGTQCYPIVQVCGISVQGKRLRASYDDDSSQTFQIDINKPNPELEILTIDIWKKAGPFGGKDEPVGHASIPLSGVPFGIEDIRWYPIIPANPDQLSRSFKSSSSPSSSSFSSSSNPEVLVGLKGIDFGFRDVGPQYANGAPPSTFQKTENFGVDQQYPYVPPQGEFPPHAPSPVYSQSYNQDFASPISQTYVVYEDEDDHHPFRRRKKHKPKPDLSQMDPETLKRYKRKQRRKKAKKIVLYTAVGLLTVASIASIVVLGTAGLY